VLVRVAMVVRMRVVRVRLLELGRRGDDPGHL
jgi:hypothetical protein